jgi:hypothetical protein
LQERLDVPVEGGRVTDERAAHVRPVLGEITAERPRVPLKLLSPVIVMVDAAETPILAVTVNELDATVKSTKWNTIGGTVVCVAVPIVAVPVTVTL